MGTFQMAQSRQSRFDTGHVITMFSSDFAARRALSHILFLIAGLFMNSASENMGLLIEGHIGLRCSDSERQVFVTYCKLLSRQ
jgi:hypothetical protein